MKITRRQLRRIIKERIGGGRRYTEFPATDTGPEHEEVEEREYDEFDLQDMSDFERGYQDGYDGFPSASDATVDYDAGYDEGLMDYDAEVEQTQVMGRGAGSREMTIRENQRPWGSYAQKGDGSFYDVITMSPNGDSVLVDGMETYVDDVPQQLEYVSGIAMDDTDAHALIQVLYQQLESGYVEKAVEYKNGGWIF